MQINFPEFTGTKCYMMPVIQGHPESLPPHLTQYGDILKALAIQPGEIGHLTVDESYVNAGASQRGYAAGDRAVHTEACVADGNITWGPATPTWGRASSVQLAADTKIRIANSISGTCMVWDRFAYDTTEDGDLSAKADEFPRAEGYKLAAGEVGDLTIWTPHECLPQQQAGFRQFVRLVGAGVSGREPYFDKNEMLH